MAVRNQGSQDAVAMADDMARLKALSDVAIDEVATPDAGVLTACLLYTSPSPRD